MAKWIVGKGLEEYARQLQRLGNNTPEIIGKGIYAMAGVVADEVRKRIEALPAVDEQAAIYAYNNHQPAQLTKGQKAGLLEGFGVSPMDRSDGYYNVKLGFEGYNGVKTKKYPNGQPNAMIARSVESGTSFMAKRPFIRPAVNAAKKRAIDAGIKAMDKAIDDKIHSI